MGDSISLSKKDQQSRDFILNGNMWLVTAKICLPLAIFQEVNHLFTILDTMMASHISAQAVSAVAYLSQFQLMISAIGVGLASGSSIKISEAYGAGDFALVKKRVSSLLALCFGMALLVLFFLPFTSAFLRATGTPEEFISIGSRYFMVTLGGTILSFFNNVYIAIERARGNSRRIMALNMMVMALKLLLTAVFIYGLHGGIITIGVATLLSQAAMLIFAVKNLSEKNAVFGFGLSYVALNRQVTAPMVSLSLPVIIERISFSMGKTVVNAMCAFYGATTVGALGVSNNINGITTSFQDGLKDGGAAIISQNQGAGRTDRALDAFFKILAYCVLVGFAGWIFVNLLIGPLTFLFANSQSGFQSDFQQLIIPVLRYESLGGCVPLGITAAVMALLFGYGYTRLTLLINFCRVFVFRIPVLWALQNFTSFGSESAGIVMMVSNTCTGLFSALIAFFVIRRIKQDAHRDM